MDVGLVVLWAVIGAGVGIRVGEARGRGGAGVVLGLFFGPVGWIVAGLLPRTVENQAKFELAVEREKARLRAAAQQRAEAGPAQQRAEAGPARREAAARRRDELLDRAEATLAALEDEEAFARWRAAQERESRGVDADRRNP